jgi:hypothetical protein
MSTHVTGIKPFIQGVDHIALTRTIHPGDQDDDGQRGSFQLLLHIQKLCPEFGHLLLVLLLGNLVLQLGDFKHSGFPWGKYGGKGIQNGLGVVENLCRSWVSFGGIELSPISTHPRTGVFHTVEIF